MPWDFFTNDELRCKCGCGRMEMDDDFMDDIIDIRRGSEFKFIVTSAYRCPEYNNEVSTTGFNGPHTHGRAMDIRVHNGHQRRWLVRQALIAGLRVGVANSFIHIDNLGVEDGFPEDVLWTY